jgi:YD repeat-containing protein
MDISGRHGAGPGGARARRAGACVAVMLLVQLMGALVWVPRVAWADSLSYAYDAAGRVIQATNTATGQAVFYSYDAAGNITSQQIVALSTLAISGFSATQGAAGTQLTIDGTGFSTTPGNNTVTINGVTATVVSATATQLVVTIPVGATSGVVSVQSGAASANSPTPFAVNNSDAAPVITGFSPTGGAAGTVVTLSGSNFSPTVNGNKVLINGTPAAITAATATSVSFRVPPDVSSGVIQAFTPYGSATGAGNFIVPPQGHALSEVGTVVQVTENVITGAFASSSALTLVLFNGKQGDAFVRIPVQASATSVSVIDPHGIVIATASSFPAMVSLGTLKSTGTYTVAISTAASGASITANATTGQTGRFDLSYGDLVGNNWGAVNVGYAQPAVLSLGGAAGQVTEIDIMRNFASWTFSLLNPSGQSIWSSSVTSSTQTVTLPALPADGIYQLVMDPGFASASIQYIASVVAPSVMAPGSSITTGAGPNSNSGAAARIAFSGTAGQYVNINVGFPRGSSQVCDFFYVTGTTFNYLGGNSGGGSCAGNFSAVLGPLPATTTYYLFTYLNSATYTTMTVNRGTVASLSINAAATPLALGNEFQIINFAATAGQGVTLHGSPSQCLASWQLISPSNAMVGHGSTNTGSVSFGALSAAGTYTLVLNTFSNLSFGANSFPPPTFYDQLAYGPYSPWSTTNCSIQLTSP